MKRDLSCLSCLAVLTVLTAVPAAASDTLPTKRFPSYAVAPYDWPVSTPEEQGLPSELFENAFSRAEELPTLYSVLVARNGHLVAERYFSGQNPNRANYIASTTKSFTSALVGIALAEGYLDSLDQRMLDFFPQYVTADLDPRKRDITIRHLLQMRAGYGNDGGEPWERSPDWIGSAIALPLTGDPGTKWDYSTGSSNILAAILTEATGMSAEDFARIHLFGPLGIDLAYWEQDPQGYNIGGYRMYLAPRDMARFGHLYLQNGAVDGLRILPASWTRASVRSFGPTTASHHWRSITDSGYGFQWWTGRLAGLEVYHAVGHGGQEILNVPELAMTIVTTSDAYFPGEVAWPNHQDIIDFIASEIVAPAKRAIRPPLESQSRGAVELVPCPVPGTDEEMLCGSFDVNENRRAQSGRVLTLRLAVLPARMPSPRPDPIFVVWGGPGGGGSATALADALESSWLRAERDVVLVDQRGTGGSNALDCELPGSPEDAQGYLVRWFDDADALRRCKRQLAEVANLRMYTTPNAMDDLDDVRAAMGYGRINLIAGMRGTRSALVYLRRHRESVRRVILEGAAPLAHTYPLYSAEAAQRSLDRVFGQCARDAACAAAYPDLEQELETVLERLEQAPVTVTVNHPDTSARVEVELSRQAFAETLLYVLLDTEDTRWVPYVVHLMFEGDYVPVAQAAVEVGRGFRQAFEVGAMLSTICAEDVPRIRPAAIPRLTEGTFLGDDMVRRVLALCEIWPTAPLGETYWDEVTADAPVLIWSGTLDPVQAPKWGNRAAHYLPQGLHLVVPAANDIEGECYDAVNQRFLNRASVAGLNTRCTRGMRLPPFEVRD